MGVHLHINDKAYTRQLKNRDAGKLCRHADLKRQGEGSERLSK